MIVRYTLLTPIIDKFLLLFLVLIVTYEVSIRVVLTAMVFISDKGTSPKYHYYFLNKTSLK